MPPFFIYFHLLGWTDNTDPTQPLTDSPARAVGLRGAHGTAARGRTRLSSESAASLLGDEQTKHRSES